MLKVPNDTWVERAGGGEGWGRRELEIAVMWGESANLLRVVKPQPMLSEKSIRSETIREKS